jgi:hypothetical protein
MGISVVGTVASEIAVARLLDPGGSLRVTPLVSCGWRVGKALPESSPVLRLGAGNRRELALQPVGAASP